jgi:cell division protein FtsB
MSSPPELSHLRNETSVSMENYFLSAWYDEDDPRQTGLTLTKSKRELELEAEYATLKAENAALKAEIAALEAENAALKAENAALRDKIAKLKREIAENVMMKAKLQSFARKQDQTINYLMSRSGRLRSYAGFTTSRLIRRLE